MKRFVNIYVPVTTCNLKCEYCYITQSGLWKNKVPEFKYSSTTIQQALSKERLGGICHINICGGGETLIPKQIVPITKGLLEEGHFIMIVTNGTISQRFDEFLELDDELKKRLGFKFSFHYKQLINNEKLMDEFLNNVDKIRKNGMSFSIEMTPSDDLIPLIPEIKKFCIHHFGALCHVTVARNTIESNIPILTKLSKEQYNNIWSQFNSPMFDFKMKTFNVKRSEYCYAGDWSLWVNLGTGIATQCYSSCFKQNIFDNINSKIKFCAVGNKCSVPHCHNSHALLTMGVIPEINYTHYNEIRDRVTINGEHWLNGEMRSFLYGRLEEENKVYSKKKEFLNSIKGKLYRIEYIVKRVLKNV